MTDTPDMRAAIQAAIKDSRRPLAPGEAEPMRPGPRVQAGAPAATAAVAAAAAAPGRWHQLGWRFLAGVVVLVLAAAFTFKLQVFLGNLGPKAHPGFGDFDLFRLVGRMGLSGHVADAYDPARLGAAQLAAGGEVQPWAYPPQFDLVAMGLALIPAAQGFGLLLGLPFAIYLILLWLLSGRRPEPALILTAPALLITMLGGQNGFLTASLAGLFALAALRGWALAGLPLGLLAIKPHLGLGLGLLTLFRRHWWMVKIALLTVLVTSALATWVLGPGIWAAFLGGLQHASGLLREDGFHLSRLISVFAAARGAGLPVGQALLLQGITVLLAAAVLYWAVWRGLGLRAELGLAMLATLMMSPYGFDYDLPIFGLAVALLWPELAPRMWRLEGVGLAVLSLIVCGTSLAFILVVGDMKALEHLVRAGRLPVMAGPAMLLAMLWSALILRRAPRRSRAAA